jgi:DNA-binding IclR family transcriptional regulator
MLPEEWTADVKPRKGSAAATLLPIFYDHPVMTASEVEEHAGANRAAAYGAIARLESAGIIREITGRKRDRVWMADDLLAELDDLDRRIQAGMR